MQAASGRRRFAGALPERASERAHARTHAMCMQRSLPRRGGACCVVVVYFVATMLRVAGGLTLYLAYPSGDGGGGALWANGAADLARAMEARNAASNVSVTAVPVPCDGVGERTAAMRWAVESTPPAAVVGGCCNEGSACQNVVSQILFGPQRGSPSSLHMYPSLESASEAVAAFAQAMKWRTLLVVTQDGLQYEQRTEHMLRSLINSNIYARLATYQENATLVLGAEPHDYDGLVWLADCGYLQRPWQRGDLGDVKTLVPLAFAGPQTTTCLPADYDGFVFVEGFNTLSGVNVSSCGGIAAANSSVEDTLGMQRCLAMDAATVALAALQASASGSFSAAPLKSLAGLTGGITFSASGNRKYDVAIRQYVNGSVTRSAAYNGTALVDIEGLVASDYTQLCEGNCSYAAKVVACLLGVQLILGSGLAISTMAFNWVKRKDRMIKLTSPNLNVVTCAGCISAYVSIVLLGLGEPWVQDLQIIAKLKQAGVFLLSVALTVVLGSVFLKTWRIYRIFSKPQSKGTVTRDEHLLLMLCGLLVVDLIIHVAWLTTDPYQCTRNAYADGFRTELHYSVAASATCSAQNSSVWYAVLYAYKFALLSAAAYCAFRIRHVNHPSLNDSSNTFASSWTIAVAALSTMPLVLCDGGGGQYKLGTSAALVLAAFLATTSSLLWQFVPKIVWTVKNKGLQGHLKFRHAIRLKQSKTPDTNERKQRAPPGPPSASIARSPWRRSVERGAPLCDALMRQELECLKQKLKEKDDTIRELTDRLFFGAEHFRAYVERKAAPTATLDRSHAMRSSRDSASLSPTFSGASSAADVDDSDDDDDDDVFTSNAPADCRSHGAVAVVVAARQLEAAADRAAARAAISVAPRRSCEARESSGPFDAAARSTGLHLDADCAHRAALGSRAVTAARPNVASVSSAASAFEQPSPYTDDEPDSGVYTASCSEKGFANWLRSSRGGGVGGPSDAKAGSSAPPPPLPPLRGQRRPALTAAAASRSIFLVECSREDVATDV